jgi:hypothetical protein
MRHARHEKAIQAFERATIAMPAGQKYIVIVYDGPDIPAFDRLASYTSDAPRSDVAKICKAMSEQLRD